MLEIRPSHGKHKVEPKTILNRSEETGVLAGESIIDTVCTPRVWYHYATHSVVFFSVFTNFISRVIEQKRTLVSVHIALEYGLLRE